MKEKVNLSKIHVSKVFYEYIYPCYAKEFLFGNDYEEFANLIQERFILTSNQWEVVLNEWDFKESLLNPDYLKGN